MPGGTGAVPSLFLKLGNSAKPEHTGAMNGEIGRKHPAHPPVQEVFNSPVIIFLTVCTQERQRVLASADGHALLREAWEIARLWMVGRYVIMPDHVHLFCAPAQWPAPPLESWVSYWKSRCQSLEGRPPRRPKSGTRTRTGTTRRSSLQALAAGFLGYAVAADGELRGEMGLCGKQSCACRLGRACRRLAVSR